MPAGKFCVNCRFERNLICFNPKVDLKYAEGAELDPVTGLAPKNFTVHRTCKDARATNNWTGNIILNCAHEGAFFEPR